MNFTKFAKRLLIPATVVMPFDLLGANPTFNHRIVSSTPNGCYNQSDLAAGAPFQPVMMSSPNGESITLYFGYFRAFANRFKQGAENHCNIKIKMSAEPGMQYQIYFYKAEIFTHRIPEHTGQNHLSFSYGLDFQPNVMYGDDLGFLLGRYWSPCGKPSEVTLNLKAFATVLPNGQEHEFLISNLSLHYKTRRCN